MTPTLKPNVYLTIPEVMAHLKIPEAKRTEYEPLMIQLMHLATDYVTSRVGHRFKAQERMKAYFTTLGFDQFLHFAALVLTIIGVVLEVALRRAGNLPAAIAVGVLGIAAVVFGELDDAPGLAGMGLVLIASACALALRRARPEPGS